MAARLTGYKIDIRPESEVEFVDESSDQAEKENKEAESDNLVAGDASSASDVTEDSAAEEEPEAETSSEETKTEDGLQAEATTGETIDTTEE